MDVKEKDRDVLLVKEKGSNELKVADKDGKMKAVKPEDVDNPELFKFNMHGNLIGNFFENFKRQVKEPTHFEFFHAPLGKLDEVVKRLYEAFNSPNKPENKDFLDLHRVEPEDFLKKQEQTKNYAIDPNLVHWEKLEKFGINRETLEKTGISKDGTSNCDRLLNYGKTNLVTVTFRVDDETKVRTDACLSLHRQEDGSFVPAIHPIRHKPDLDSLYFGVKFSEEDKQKLLKTGNLGRVAEVEFKQGEKTPILISIDRLTNELVPFRADRLKIPETYRGVTLNEQQKQDLGEGKSVRIENMYSAEKDKYYSADVQFNASNRCLMPFFGNDKKQRQSQENDREYVQKTFRGKELTADQRDSLREGKTVNVKDLVDKNGKGYSGYITLDKETGKTDFMFPKQYRDALAAGKVIPDDRNPTKASEKQANRQERKEEEQKRSHKHSM